jgi:ATP-binding cassette, subfamily C, bacterial CydCD
VSTTSTTGTASTTIPADSAPLGPTPPRLVDPRLAARVPGLWRAAAVALVIGVATAVVVVVQAIALATAVERSLLHHAPLHDVLGYIVVVGIALLVRAALTGVSDLFTHGTADRVVTGLRHELLTRALALGPGWLVGERPGELSLTATRGLRSLHAYLARYLPQAAAAAVIPVMLLAWIATQDWLSLVVVVALVAAVPVTMIFFGREATRRSERQWRRLGSLAARFLQLVEGLPTLRAFGREGQGRREVEAATEGVRTATMRTLRVAFVSALAMDMIAGFGVGLVAMVLGLRLLWGQLGLETAMAVLLVAPEIFIPLRRAGAEFHASTEGQAAVARVLSVLNTPVPAAAGTNGAEAADASGTAPSSEVDERTAPASASALRVAGVRVEYPHRERPALAACSFELAAGARLALTGPSGAGKSTVLAALLRFVDPVAGEMFFGGRPSTALSAREWRTTFSWLPQRPHLFHTTLAENLRIGAPRAADEDLERVLAAVGLHTLMATLPKGLATVVGHDGLTLSAGERQRVALARALLCPAPVLLLDEPTASLDPPTVARLAPAIEPWLNGRSVVVAAHESVLLPRFDAVRSLEAPASLPVVAFP